MKESLKKKGVAIAIVAGIAAIAWTLWRTLQPEGFGDAFVSGNGRIEATEINVAAKLGGRVEEIFVREGEFVKAHQPLVKMQVATLEAQRDEARAGIDIVWPQLAAITVIGAAFFWIAYARFRNTLATMA